MGVHACRAGSDGLWFGDEIVALGAYEWYEDNPWEEGMEYAQVVGVKWANVWGLQDMYGNVWSASKIRNDARFKFSDISFRIVEEGEGE